MIKKVTIKALLVAFIFSASNISFGSDQDQSSPASSSFWNLLSKPAVIGGLFLGTFAAVVLFNKSSNKDRYSYNSHRSSCHSHHCERSRRYSHYSESESDSDSDYSVCRARGTYTPRGHLGRIYQSAIDISLQMIRTNKGF